MRPDFAPVIEVRDVVRSFRVERERRTLFRLIRDVIGHGRASEVQLRHALRGVSLRVGCGERVAIIGNNAAGKSTLLKIVAGLLRPTSGTVSVQGDRVLLTSLGVGMIDDVSVLDNTLMYGALYGIEPARIRAVFDDILEWAGMEGYEHSKLKTLSSGTRARLAFSVVRYIATDVFLIDEALSAGDATFRAKCRAFFDERGNQDRTFLVATHDMKFAQSFCTRALWLHEGSVMAFGDSRQIVAQYVASQPVPGATLMRTAP
jgi:ABC-type polysaccharide/polyol phosphate transport system ATPase subunit